jgi:hypothetical protein
MIKINKIVNINSVLIFFTLFWQTSLSANTGAESFVGITDNINKTKEKRFMQEDDQTIKNTLVKIIQIEIVKLTDNSGLTYVGGKISAVDLEPYLSQMKLILGDDFSLYRQNQSARDHHTFHMTLINPYEYQSLTKKVAFGETLSISLRGLASVSTEDKKTFFVVAQSLEAKSYRQNLVLNNKDFHVTLGFNPSDIYGVNKGIESLVK